MSRPEAVIAYALIWPNDPLPLLFRTFEAAEENRKWFSSHYKFDRNGNPRGEPRIAELMEKPT